MRVLRVLRQLPSLITVWSTLLQQHIALMQEYNNLLREIIRELTDREPETAPTDLTAIADQASAIASSTQGLTGLSLIAPLPASSHPLAAVPDVPASPKDPKRIRTAADVTYSSRTFLREQDSQHLAGRRR